MESRDDEEVGEDDGSQHHLERMCAEPSTSRCCQSDCEPAAPASFVFQDEDSVMSSGAGDISFRADLLSSTMLSVTAGSPFVRTFSSVGSQSPDESGRTLRDSGFFDQSSRRRPAGEEVEFGVAFYFKRRREFD